MIQQLVERRLLVIDDEPELLKALVVLIEAQNVQVETASNGRAGLELLKSKEFHAVLCDIAMPEMTGLECLTQANSVGCMTPFVFLTGRTEVDALAQAVRLGALDFIAKPFSVEELTEVLYRALDIGMRRKRILKEMEAIDPERFARISRDVKMISIMRVMNNSRRSG